MAQASPAPAEQQVKQRALRRLALAVALIGLAVVGIALLDHYSTSREPTPAQLPDREPPAVAALPPPKPIAPPPSEAPADAVPPMPPPPSVAAEPPAPSEARPRAEPPARPSPSVSASVEDTSAPTPAAAAQLGGPPQAVGGITPGFVVQLGLFSTVENAQALRARLESQGIPVFLETRVVVGPFRDRAEADAALAKLKALGVAGVVAQRK
jgi:cell division septation protein DedD